MSYVNCNLKIRVEIFRPSSSSVVMQAQLKQRSVIWLFLNFLRSFQIYQYVLKPPCQPQAYINIVIN